MHKSTKEGTLLLVIKAGDNIYIRKMIVALITRNDIFGLVKKNFYNKSSECDNSER